MKKLYVLLIFILSYQIGFCQSEDCDTPSAVTLLQSNYLQMQVNNKGNLIGTNSGLYGLNVNLEEGNLVNIAGICGLWFGGVDPAGNLKVAAASFISDFYAGPLDPATGNTFADSCANWDRIWKVERYQIERLLNEIDQFGTVLTIDNDIFGWPGFGNPYFESIQGFSLPESANETAPFFDEDQDGIYDPLNGDFPLPENISTNKIPETTTFCIINDAGNFGNVHQNTEGDKMNIQIGQTTWSYLCEPENPLNHTFFVSLNVKNQSLEDIDSLHFGTLFTANIGFNSDDYLGCSPSQNAYFCYNSDAEDGGPDDESLYENSPPAEALIYLNKPMANYIAFNHIIGEDNSLYLPTYAKDYYTLLTGSWLDDSPITTGGIGYETGASTNFAFPGNPNNLNEWSMLSANIPNGSKRGIGSVHLPNLSPGDHTKIDFALTFVREADASNLENVTAMYAQIDEIQELYDNQFEDDCLQTEICNDDCVWTGDANADGIANHCDLFAIGLALNTNETTRNIPHNWSPQASENWSNNLPDGTNFKHADCDGNGMIELSDKEKTELFYGLTNEKYSTEEDVYQEGSELMIGVFADTPDLTNLASGESLILPIRLTENVPNLFGLAFSVEFEAQYFEGIRVHSSTDYRIYSPKEYNIINEKVDCAVISADPNEPLTMGNCFTLFIDFKEEIIGNAASVTSELKFKNIKAIDNNGNPIEIGGTGIEFTFTDVNATQEASKNGFQIFPNPTSNFLNINFKNQTLQTLKVVDLTGQVLIKKQGHFSENLVLNLADLPTGIYILQLENENHTFFQKITKL